MFSCLSRLTFEKAKSIFLTADLLESESRDIQRYIQFINTCFNKKAFEVLTEQYKTVLEQLWLKEEVVDLEFKVVETETDIGLAVKLLSLNGKTDSANLTPVEKRIFKNITSTLRAAQLEIFIDGAAKATIQRFSEANQQYYVECQTEKKKPNLTEANAFYLVYLFNHKAIEIEGA